MPVPTPNSDESLVTSDHPFIGNFHKTLPHNEYGEVEAEAAIRTLFDCALQHDSDPGKLRAPLDLTLDDCGHSVSRQTLFRSGLYDEQYRPLVSQFFIRPIGTVSGFHRGSA